MYSSTGLDAATAIFAHHADIWFMSAKPFDALLRMSAQTSQSALQNSLQRGADFVSKALSCSMDHRNASKFIQAFL